MKQNKKELQERLQTTFGPAPASYREDMRRTLADIREEQPMRKSKLGLVLAMTLLVALCGSALAARHFSALDFLFPQLEASPEVQAAVQSEFVQEGGDLGPVRATVRDAVSDGIAVHVVMEYQAVNPLDVVLMEYDTDRDEEGKPGPYPHLGSFDDDTTKWVVWGLLWAEVSGESVYAGVEWKYETPQTLLVKYVLDLTTIDPLPESLEVEFTPNVFTYEQLDDNSSTWPSFSILVRLDTGSMPQRVLRAKEEVEFSGIRLTGAEAVLTPLATYVELRYGAWLEVDEDTLEQAYQEWSDTYSNLWFHMLGADGKPLPTFTGGRKYDDINDIHPIQERVKLEFGALSEVPETLTFAPYLVDTGEELSLFTVEMEEKK